MSLDSLAWTQMGSPRNAPHENRELTSKEPGHILEAVWPWQRGAPLNVENELLCCKEHS